MNTLLIIFLVVMVAILLVRNAKMNTENKYLNITIIKQKSELSYYFQLFMQYKNFMAKNNIQNSNDVSLGVKEELTVDSILNEIADVGIENVSEEKLNFLKNYKNGKV